MAVMNRTAGVQVVVAVEHGGITVVDNSAIFHAADIPGGSGQGIKLVGNNDRANVQLI